MKKIPVLQLGAYSAKDEQALNEHFTMHRYFDMQKPEDFLAEQGANIRAIATRGDLGADAYLINALPALEMIAVYGVGVDAVATDLAKERGIHVTNTPDVLTGDVADFAVAMLLGLSRSLFAGEHWVRSGQWQKQGGLPLNTRVYGKSAGILGLGRIGEALATRLAGFNMPIYYSARTPRTHTPPDWTYIKDPVELATQVDFLFVTLAATPDTRHIVDAKVLKALGETGSLINVSRAANVDEIALLNALEAGGLRGAALDVFEGEPAINPRFLALDNVLLQPHQGSGTVETRQAMGDLMRENLLAHFSGQALLTPV